MASTIPLSVAIYDNPGIMHWSLYLEADNYDDKTIIHVLGARQKYFPDVRTPSDARSSSALIELLYLCQIDASKIEVIKNIAYATPIKNELADWSCQDYVLDVLKRLERALIIDTTDGDYIINRQAVAAKRESWA
ncbi:uncharacterized protein N7479_006066 [Penicillium vulpinum]|uniref:Uncharacterized protein n=1 Tax=Penicillium vulpinum TaxID=29845 RepID=A0A1V6SDW1_9EURO|nr:uncharacterized protein N7479_006066 [Penicillium vulpinum]KAJ5958916.1 hypothetical protein N7479_006066 [Penicillium vulpinum]OQE12212.1 hypothetical protein PENVUL_c001G10011 [Penicillium vulpinum]